MRFINFAIPVFFGLGLLAGIYVYMLITAALTHVGVHEPAAITTGRYVAFLGIIFASYIIVKRNIDFTAPSITKTAVGHFLLAVANIAAFGTTAGPMLYAHFTGNPENSLYMYFALPVIIVNMVLWPLGWKLATSSKSKHT